MALFEATGLHKRFGDQVVLQDVSLAFDEGRLTGIMGPNGAGKTTCFNVLTGRYRPERGRVTLRRRRHHRAAAAPRSPPGISRSFQAMNLFDADCALDNVLSPCRACAGAASTPGATCGADSAAEQQAAGAAGRVGLAGKERRLAQANSSYGERRALEIAVALAAEPRLLFLDEPTAGLGAQATKRLAELIGG